MNCKYCGSEHPKTEMGNPWYCMAIMEAQIDEKDDEIAALKSEVRRLGDRDGNASIQLIFPDENPFNGQKDLTFAEKLASQQIDMTPAMHRAADKLLDEELGKKEEV